MGHVMAGKMNSALHFGHALQLALIHGAPRNHLGIQGRFGVSRGQGLRIGILRRFSWREKSISEEDLNMTCKITIFVEWYGYA